MLEGHTRDVLCLDVQKEAAFSGKDGKNHHNDGYFHSIACDLHEDDVICLSDFYAVSSDINEDDDM